MDALLPPIPEHLATLGMFDGLLGMATLGFIIEPELVSRFPADAWLEGDSLLAFVTEEDLVAELEAVPAGLVVELEGQDILGLFTPRESLTAEVDGEIFELEASMADGEKLVVELEEGGLCAELAEEDQLEGAVEECDLSAEVEVEGDDVAELEERPGEGRCSR